MNKKIDKHEHNMVIVAIIGIIAILAMFLIFITNQTGTQAETKTKIGDDLTGQAFTKSLDIIKSDSTKEESIIFGTYIACATEYSQEIKKGQQKGFLNCLDNSYLTFKRGGGLDNELLTWIVNFFCEKGPGGLLYEQYCSGNLA